MRHIAAAPEHEQASLRGFLMKKSRSKVEKAIDKQSGNVV